MTSNYQRPIRSLRVFIAPLFLNYMNLVSPFFPLALSPIPKFAKDLEVNEKKDKYTTDRQQKNIQKVKNRKTDAVQRGAMLTLPPVLLVHTFTVIFPSTAIQTLNDFFLSMI